MNTEELKNTLNDHSEYLRNASLYHADLRGANLRSANLRGATLNWQSHALLGEILQRSASTLEQRMIAGIVAVSLDWCWDDFAREFSESQKVWVRSVFAPLVKEGDDLPKQLQGLKCFG